MVKLNLTALIKISFFVVDLTVQSKWTYKVWLWSSRTYFIASIPVYTAYWEGSPSKYSPWV